MNEKLKNYIDWIQYDELIAGVNNCPHKLLGNHIYDGHQIICAYRPAADYIKIFDRNGKNERYLDKIDDKGKFPTGRFLSFQSCFAQPLINL